MTEHDLVLVTFPDGPKHVKAHFMNRFFEGEYHYVREPYPHYGFNMKQDTYGHWTATECEGLGTVEN